MSNGRAANKDGVVMRNTGAVAVFSLLTAVTGLLIDVLLARHFGLGSHTDAFYTAYTVPFFFSIIAFSLGYSTLIPVFSRYVADRGPGELSPFLSTYMNIAGLGGAAVSLAGFLLSGPVVGMVAPGLDPATAGLAEDLSRVLFGLVAFSFVAEVMRAFLYARGAFVLASSSNFIRNGVVVASLVLFYDTHGIMSAAYGYAAGYAAQFIALGFRVFTGHGVRYVPRIDRGAWGLRDCVRIGMAQWAGFSILQGITFAERIIGSYLPTGSITALSYASRIVYMAVELVSGSVATATLPRLSRAVGARDGRETAKVLGTTFRAVLLVFMPLTVAVTLLAEPMMTVLYKRGAFTQEAVGLTAWVFMLYGLSFVFQGLNRIIHNYLFAAMNPRGSLTLFLTISAVTVVSDVCLVGPLGISALPLGYLIGSGTAFIVGYSYYMRGTGVFSGGEAGSFLARSAAFGILSGGCYYLSFTFINSLALFEGNPGLLAGLVASLVPASVASIALGRILDIDEVLLLKEYIRQKHKA